ncbi:MAG: GAF domain-containing protein [Myxococcaceae bacterium]
MSARLTVAILPASSSLAEPIARAIDQVQAQRVPLDPKGAIDVVVADLTSKDAASVRERMDQIAREGTSGIVAVVTTVAEGLVPAEDFVVKARLAEELPVRLLHAAERRATVRDRDQRQQDLAVLLELTGRYSETLDAVGLLHDVTRRLVERLDIMRASLIVLDEPSDSGFVVASSDDASLKGLRIELSRYPEIREVVRTRKPVILEEAPTHPLLEGFQAHVAAQGIRAIAAVPLVLGNKVLGVLLVRAGAARPAFSPREVDFLATVGHATAIAVRNARLLESVRGETEREKSARHQAEAQAAELRQTKDFLERLIDSSVDAIIAADMTGRVLLFNKGAEAILGYSADEAVKSLNVRDIYPLGDAQRVMERLRSPEFGGPGRLSMTRQDLVAKDGEHVPVNLTASILVESDREVATVGIFSDLRGLMALEKKLTAAQSKLEESEKNAVIVALAGTAAHELNQPLTSVMGYAELLRRKLKEDDFAYGPVEIIYREAERMAELVKRIGKITRYETKSYVGKSKIIDLEKASSDGE